MTSLQIAWSYEVDSRNVAEDAMKILAQATQLIERQPHFQESDAAAEVFYNLGLCYSAAWFQEAKAAEEGRMAF